MSPVRQAARPTTPGAEGPAAASGAAGRVRKSLELVSLFFLLPAGLTVLRYFAWHRLPVIPVLWAVALPASVWLARHGVAKEELFGRREDFRAMPRLLLRAAVLAIPLVALLRAIRPGDLFALPRHLPVLWLLVLVFYPLLSVFPQGLLYRGFFFHRYGDLFPNATLRRVAAALCFSFSHVFFLNPWALLLTFVGGLLFSRTYERTGSVLLSDFEHAVYGDLVFTIGYGAFLYHGTLQMLGS